MLCNDREAGQLKFSLKGVFSPLLVYTLVGLAIYIFQLPLPEVIRTTITTGSKAMTPCGMILCGLLLGQTNLGEKLHSPKLYAFLAAKLLGAPLAMMGVMAVLGFSGIVAQLPVQNALVLILLSMVLTLIGGFIPARQAAKKDPVIALRSE
jgi:predicted permease